MLDHLAATPGALPLLQFAAARLWDLRDRSRRLLTRASYDAIGGVTGALARHADEMVDAMPAAERRLVREAFRHLVTSDGTCAVLERKELHQLLGAGAEAEHLVERLVETRLLISSENDRGAGVIEIVHEALIREWPRLVAWRREDALGSRFHEQLRSAARQWDDRGRPRGLLWRGDALAEYQLLAPAPRAAPDAARGRLRCGEHRRGRARPADPAGDRGRCDRDHRRRSSPCCGARTSPRTDAKHEAEALLRDSYFEQGRLRVLDGDKLGALAPLATAYRMGSTGAATRLLLEEAARPTRARLLTLAGHTDKLWSVAYSPDGKWLATASSDRHGPDLGRRDRGACARRCSTPTASARSRSAPTRGSWRAAAPDRTVRVWDVIAGREVAALPVDAGTRRVAFSPDGSMLLTASAPARGQAVADPERRAGRRARGSRADPGGDVLRDRRLHRHVGHGPDRRVGRGHARAAGELPAAGRGSSPPRSRAPARCSRSAPSRGSSCCCAATGA